LFLRIWDSNCLNKSLWGGFDMKSTRWWDKRCAS
jgi:hypothetical protein